MREGLICRSSVSRFSFSSIVVKSALCAARILVVSLAFSFICSIVFSTFSMRVVTVPSVDATPVAVAMASVLNLIDFSLLNCYGFKKTLDIQGNGWFKEGAIGGAICGLSSVLPSGFNRRGGWCNFLADWRILLCREGGLGRSTGLALGRVHVILH